LRFHVCAVAGLPQEPDVYQFLQQREALATIEAPQSLRLLRRETEPGALKKFPLNPKERSDRLVSHLAGTCKPRTEMRRGDFCRDARAIA
jgi:hypothetical protein